MACLPHPIPYQGSKRLLAARILDYAPRKVETLYEPFAGSAALTIAAANLRLADHYVIGDSLVPLAQTWERLLADSQGLADEYADVWNGHEDGGHDYYNRVRADFNRMPDPARLLYLFARCVKNSPRFNSDGLFNQSPDRRRLGMRPLKMRAELIGASRILSGRTRVVGGDFMDTLAPATPRDLVYLDPPWQGTTYGIHKRYHQGLSRERLVAALADLARRNVPVIVSYDGRCGAKVYGEALPADLGLVRVELDAGRSTQATLNGRDDVTVESLYISPRLLGC